MLNAQFGEVLADDFRGSVFVVRQLGMPMDVVADLDEIGNDGSDAFCVRGHATRIGDEPRAQAGQSHTLSAFVDQIKSGFVVSKQPGELAHGNAQNSCRTRDILLFGHNHIQSLRQEGGIFVVLGLTGNMRP